MTELKPCPFCGAPYPYLTFERGYIDDSAIIFYNACKACIEDNFCIESVEDYEAYDWG